MKKVTKRNIPWKETKGGCNNICSPNGNSASAGESRQCSSFLSGPVSFSKYVYSRKGQSTPPRESEREGSVDEQETKFIFLFGDMHEYEDERCPNCERRDGCIQRCISLVSIFERICFAPSSPSPSNSPKFDLPDYFGLESYKGIIDVYLESPPFFLRPIQGYLDVSSSSSPSPSSSRSHRAKDPDVRETLKRDDAMFERYGIVDGYHEHVTRSSNSSVRTQADGADNKKRETPWVSRKFVDGQEFLLDVIPKYVGCLREKTVASYDNERNDVNRKTVSSKHEHNGGSSPSPSSPPPPPRYESCDGTDSRTPCCPCNPESAQFHPVDIRYSRHMLTLYDLHEDTYAAFESEDPMEVHQGCHTFVQELGSLQVLKSMLDWYVYEPYQDLTLSLVEAKAPRVFFPEKKVPTKRQVIEFLQTAPASPFCVAVQLQALRDTGDPEDDRMAGLLEEFWERQSQTIISQVPASSVAMSSFRSHLCAPGTRLAESKPGFPSSSSSSSPSSSSSSPSLTTRQVTREGAADGRKRKLATKEQNIDEREEEDSPFYADYFTGKKEWLEPRAIGLMSMLTLLMDMYTLSLMFLQKRNPVCFLFAGESHIRNYRLFLSKYLGVHPDIHVTNFPRGDDEPTVKNYKCLRIPPSST